MSTPAEQLDQALAPPPPPPKEPTPAPPSTPMAPPQTLAPAYMAHSDTMRGAAAADELDASLKGQQAEEKPAEKAPPKPPSSVLEKAEAVGKDIGTGIIETPRAVVKGVRDAYQGMLDLTKEVGDFTNKYAPAIQLYGKGAPRIVSAAEREADPSLPPSLADSINLPDLNAPKSVTATVEKNVVQFLTGMASAGGQLKSLGVPLAESAGGKAALTALKGFVGQFEAFDGAQQNLSNLVQSVPSLQNPVTQFLATNPNDNDAVNRLKSAVEGAGLGQLADAFVSGVRFLRNATKAKAAVEDAAGLAEGNADLGEDIGPPTSGGLAALGDSTADDSKPLVSAKFNTAASKVSDQEIATQGVTPEEVTKTAEPAAPGEEAGPASPGATEAQAKEPQVYVNFSKINEPADIQRAMSQMVDTFTRWEYR